MITIHCDDVITLSHMYTHTHTHTHRVILVLMVMMVHLVIQVEWDLQGKQGVLLLFALPLLNGLTVHIKKK